MNDPYIKLAAKLDSMPNGFPASESGVELRILKKIFSPEAAEMALQIRPMPETAQAIADRLGKPAEEMESILDEMVKKGQIGSAKMGGEQMYLFFPFVFGIFEFQLNRMDKELAEMMDEYGPTLLKTLGAHYPPVMRVAPINVQIDAKHQVLPYEDIRLTLDKAKSFQVMECICKKEQALLGNPCKHPTEVCMAFANHEGAFDKYPMGRIISKEEALAVLEMADKEGLVHATFNVQNGQMFVCNCCSCCCGMLRGMTKLNATQLLATSNFVSSIDPDLCSACGTCADERCPVGAIGEKDGSYAVNPEKCIGCGVCIPTCPSDAIALVRKPENQHDQPPSNIVDWYFKRAAARGVPMTIN
jgi:Pyruvate/2-oxoacid:ferredoxin oxidoreductase delta subunit